MSLRGGLSFRHSLPDGVDQLWLLTSCGDLNFEYPTDPLLEGNREYRPIKDGGKVESATDSPY